MRNIYFIIGDLVCVLIYFLQIIFFVIPQIQNRMKFEKLQLTYFGNYFEWTNLNPN